MSSSSASTSQGNQAGDITLAVDEDSTPEHFQTAPSTPEGTEQAYEIYVPLCKAILGGEWEKAKEIIKHHRPYATAVITARQETALHLAVRTGYSTLFVEHLLPMMNDNDYSILIHKDIENHTVLAVSAVVGNIEVAKLLVAKHPQLLFTEHNDGELPVHMAAEHGHRLMLVYLLAETMVRFRLETMESTFFSRYGTKLVKHMITSKFVDLALVEVQNHSEIATSEDGISILAHLATTRKVFRSGSDLNSRNSVAAAWISGDILPLPYIMFLVCAAPIIMISQVIRLFNEDAGESLMHQKSVELVRFMVGKIGELNNQDIVILLQKVVLPAVNLGIHEVVEETIRSIPHIIWECDPTTNKHVFEEAITKRHLNVFNLIYQTCGHHQHLEKYKDTNNNNILHLVSKLAPQHKLDCILGAALQMQRELQWFKAVEKLVKPFHIEAKNIDGKTPKDLFSDEHKDLKTAGEKWLKNTAKSCSVVASLIATVAFTAAITVSGVSRRNHFSKRISLIMFAIWDLLAFLLSITSIVMFTSILTAHYAEDDFLKHLPHKLIIGLSSLTLSMATMVMAFVGCMSFLFDFPFLIYAVPIMIVCYLTSWFAQSHALILFDMYWSTKGPTIFQKQSVRIIY